MFPYYSVTLRPAGCGLIQLGPLIRSFRHGRATNDSLMSTVQDREGGRRIAQPQPQDHTTTMVAETDVKAVRSWLLKQAHLPHTIGKAVVSYSCVLSVRSWFPTAV